MPRQPFNLLLALAIFFAYIFVDGLYALYTLRVVKRRAIGAATTGAGMHFLLALGVIGYTSNYLYIFPLATGSWIGTYCVVKYSKH